jgi:hypothetical protein
VNSKFETSCSQLSSEELANLVIGKWGKNPNQRITTIPYTFDLKSIPKTLKDDLVSNYPTTKIESLLENAQSQVQKTFEFWKTACGDLVEFQYVEALQENQLGIRLAAWHGDAKAIGIAIYNTHGGLFQQVLVGLPKEVNSAFDQNTYSHELGHAIGLGHTHEVATILDRLRGMEQGQVCSVMGYKHIVGSETNQCTIVKFCANETYAIFPGPMDSTVCKALYTTPGITQSRYFTALFSGLYHGAVENTFSSFLQQIESFELDKEWSDRIAVELMMFVNLNSSPMNITSTLSLMELVARFQESQHKDLLRLLRVLAQIVSLLLYFYELYNDEEALTKAMYLGVCLVGYYCGSTLGSPIGEVTGKVTNSLLNNLGSVFYSSVKWAVEVIPTSISNLWFFKQKEVKPPTGDEEFIDTTYFPQEITAQGNCSLN